MPFPDAVVSGYLQAVFISLALLSQLSHLPSSCYHSSRHLGALTAPQLGFELAKSYLDRHALCR